MFHSIATFVLCDVLDRHDWHPVDAMFTPPGGRVMSVCRRCLKVWWL